MPELGTESILIVDHEVFVRQMAVAMLNRYGYTAITAGSTEDALEILRGSADLTIDLALIDASLDWESVVRELRGLRSRMPILFLCDFPGREDIFGQAPFLYKPFTSPVLIGRIREMLDRPQTAAAGGSL